MPNGSNNGKNGNRLFPFVVLFGSGLLGGGGGTYLVVSSGVAESIVRPDPFTGSQGAQLTTRLDAIDRRLQGIEDAVNRGILPRSEERLQRHDAELSEIRRRVDRLEDRR